MCPQQHHDVRCLVQDEAQHPWFCLSLDRLTSKIAKVEDSDIQDV